METTHTGPLMPLKEGALSSFADGRPPGPQYGHQRYEELFPTRFLQSGVTGARVNPGTRDSQQRHAYAAGEFAPGGLYHNTVHGLAAGVCASLTTRQACEAEAHPQTVASDKLCSWEQDHCSGKFDGSTEGIPVRFHPAMPVQDSQSLWTFDGTLPPKLLSTRYGEPLLFRNYNALPIKFEGNRGFGSHFITTHEHNGHVGAESDGYAEAFFLPGQFYDYHWPMLLAGHDSINRDAQDGRASAPCQPGETLEISFPSPGADANGEVCSRAEGLSENPTRTDSGVYTDSEACGWRKQLELCPASGAGAGHIGIPGDWRETMSTHWFHDHMIDYTAQNVYKGNAAMMNYYSGVDRGNECLEDGVNLRFPSGCGMDPWSWGNRDYDVLLVMASKAWGQDDSRYPGTSVADTRGQLWFNPFNTDGFIGDQMTVNWLWRPYLDVRARSYRFRLVNGDVSRFMVFAVVVERDDERGEFAADRPGISYDRVPIYMIANDGNIMEHAVPFDGSIDLDSDGDLQDHNGILPTQSIAERYDVIIDFERYAPGSKLYVVNLLEHDNGKRPERQIPLADVLAGRYGDCDSGVGTVLEFRVHAYAGVDRSMDPRRYVPGNENGAEGAPLKMIPLPEIGDEELLAAHHRTFELGRGAVTDSVPVNITPASFTSASPAPGLEGLFDFDVNGRSVDTTENAALPERPRKRWGILTDGMGSMRASNFNQVVAAPEIGALEIWHLINEGNGWSHNMHIHFEEGRILTRDGEPPPEWEKWARKDVYRVGRMDDSGSEVSVAIRFREFAGSYMEHCHNTQHEDTAMLMRWDVENPGQLKPFLLPENQWNGCTYTESVELLTASSQRAETVGNPDAKAAYELAYSVAALLCPGGATEDCPGVDSGPAPVATLIPPPVTTSPTPDP
ncbi:MAG: multicopper oxidase domain-containing protein, partial [Myxococcota bacterium]